MSHAQQILHFLWVLGVVISSTTCLINILRFLIGVVVIWTQVKQKLPIKELTWNRTNFLPMTIAFPILLFLLLW